MILTIGMALGIYHDSFNDFVSTFTTTLNSLVLMILYILFLPFFIRLILTIFDTIRITIKDTYKYDIVKLGEFKCKEIYSSEPDPRNADDKYNKFATQSFLNSLKIHGATPSSWSEKLNLRVSYFYALLHLRIKQALTDHRKWIDRAKEFMNLFK